jgi:hypothetical protein
MGNGSDGIRTDLGAGIYGSFGVVCTMVDEGRVALHALVTSRRLCGRL